MLTVPPLTPVTTPVEASTVAIAVLPLLQVPPVVAFDKVLVAPTQAVAEPPIAAGAAGTVITLNATVAAVGPQPLDTE